MIDQFGVQAVIGSRCLSAAEIRAINTGQAVINAYNSRAKAKSRVEWSRANREASALLCAIEKAINGR